MGHKRTIAEMGRNNSIGFLRLVAALLVIVGHSFPYGGFGADPLIGPTHNQLATGRLPVELFFTLSGFLIAQSYVRSGHWAVFTWHRILRIYPALIVCLAITVLVIAPILGDGGGLLYFIRNVTLIAPIGDSIPGLFDGTPGHGSVNSALWTLPWEIRAYVLVLVLGVLGLLRKLWVVGSLFLLSWAGFVALIFSFPGTETSPAVTSGLRLITFFLAGTLFYLLREKIQIRTDLFLAALGVMIAAVIIGVVAVPYSGGLFYIVAPIPFAYAVFYLADRLPFRKINARYDFSYGTYIYGTLILNILANAGLNQSWLTYVALATVLALVTAAASWYFIEKPALGLKDLRLSWSPRGPRVIGRREEIPA